MLYTHWIYVYLVMMSEKSNIVKRSKIPRFQGTTKKASVADAEKVISNNIVLKESFKTNKPKNSAISAADGKKLEISARGNDKNPDSSVGDKHRKLIDTGDVPFEPDQQALDSILTNTGIVPKHLIRASGMTSRPSIYKQFPENRLSLWESYNEFKENMKLYREKKQQYETSTNVKLTPRTPNVKLNDKSTAVTPLTCKSLSSLNQPARWRKMSLLDLYNEDKENVKIFREKMRIAESVLQTSITPGCKSSNPALKQGRLGDITRSVSSATPRSNSSYKAWTESKDNRGTNGSNRRAAIFSTSKKQSRYLSEESGSPNGGNMYLPAKPVRRPLLPSLNENVEAERKIYSDGLLDDSNKIKKSVQVASSTLIPLMLNTVYGNKEFTSASGSSSTGFNIPLFSSSVCMQSSELVPNPLTPVSGGLKSSTECTWSFKDSLCTPVRSGCGILKNVPIQETTQFLRGNITPTTNKHLQSLEQTDVSTLYKSNDRFLDNAENIADYPNFSKNILNTQFLPPCVGLSDPFSRLIVTPSSMKPDISCLGTSTLQNQHTSSLQQKTVGAQAAFSPSPIIYSSAQMPSYISEAFPYFQQLPVTPQAQLSGIFLRDQRSHLTPISYVPFCLPVRDPAVSSCLKSSENITRAERLFTRNAVTSVKKLRWADLQKEEKDF